MTKRTNFICTVENCDRPASSRGWCRMHYRRWERHGDPTARLYEEANGICCVEGCGRVVESKGYCAMHAKRARRYGSPYITLHEKQEGKCKVENCENAAISKGYCQRHYDSVFKHGREFLILPPSGTGTITKDGYLEYTIGGTKMLEHVIVAEKALGKKLPPGAVVHHVDEVKLNNTPTNLVICPDQTYHMLLHKRARMLGIKF